VSDGEEAAPGPASAAARASPAAGGGSAGSGSAPDAGPPPAARRRGRPKEAIVRKPAVVGGAPTPEKKAVKAVKAVKRAPAVGERGASHRGPGPAPPPPPPLLPPARSAPPRSRAQAVASLRGASSRRPEAAAAAPPAAEDAPSSSSSPPPPEKARRAGQPRGRASGGTAAALPAGAPPASQPKKKPPAGGGRKAGAAAAPRRAMAILDEEEAAAVASVLAPLAVRSAALSRPVPPGLGDTAEAADLLAMRALDDRMRRGRDAVKQHAISRGEAAAAAAVAEGGAAGGAAGMLVLPPLHAAAALAPARRGRPPKTPAPAPALPPRAGVAAPPSTSVDSGSTFKPAHDAVQALFAMLGHTGLLGKEAEARLTDIVRKGVAASAAGAALGASLGRAPTVDEVVASLGLRSPAHLRLLLDNRHIATDLMVQFNLRLVVHTARRYVGMGLELADLIAEGVTGLTRAIEKFDPGRGFRFSTYSMWWVRQAVTRSLSDESRVVRLPVHVYDAVAKLRRAGRALGGAVFESPNALHAALGEAVGMAPDKVAQYLSAARSTSSLDAAGSAGSAGSEGGGGGGGGAGSLATDAAPEVNAEVLVSTSPADAMFGGRSSSSSASVAKGGEAAEEGDAAASRVAALRTHGVLRERLDAVLASLPPRERNVLRLRYGLAAPGGRTMTLLDISVAYGVTTERIRQIEDAGLRRLRDPLRAAGVQDAADLVSAADAGGAAAADEAASFIAPPGVEAGPELM